MRLLFLLCIVVFASTGWSQQAASVADSDSGGDLLQPYREAALEKWEAEIQKLETLDESDTHSAEAILFIGSSSIRRWDTIAVDMAPYRVIQRGFGGSKFSDVAVFAERLMHPHPYRALVIFVGNDVTGKPTDHTPDQVEQLVRHILAVSHTHQPEAPVLIVEVTPTASRLEAWPKIRQVNARLREIALTTPHTYFVATAGLMLDPHGQPRNELFVADQLHLNDSGYQLWARLIRNELDEVLRMTQAYAAASDKTPSNVEQ